MGDRNARLAAGFRPLTALLGLLVLLMAGGGTLAADNPCNGVVTGSGYSGVLACSNTYQCTEPGCVVQVILPPPGSTTTIELCVCAGGPPAPCCQTILTSEDGSPPVPKAIGSCDLDDGCGPGNCGLRTYRINEKVFFSANCFPSF